MKTYRRSLWNASALLLLLAATTVSPHAQAQPAECQGLTAADRPLLLRRQVELEGIVADALKAGRSEAAVREQVNEQLAIAFKLDCLRPDLQEDPLSVRAPSDPSVRHLSVPVLYATNRARTASDAPERFYGDGDARQLILGHVQVSIPTRREPGDLSLPSSWRFESAPNPNKHFVLGKPTPYADRAAFEAANGGQAAAQRPLLLFVHGFRVTFEEASLRAAQLAHDLRFNGTVMLFSWPSTGSLDAYPRDEEAVELAESHFGELLGIVQGMGFRPVHLVAHSMGTRLVTRVLRQRIAEKKPLPVIRELMLAAADVNAEVFRANLAPSLAGMTLPRVTIYASSSDVALIASKIVHRFARVGDTKPSVFTYPPFETIDASESAPISRAFGHSYVFDSPSVLADMALLIHQGLGAPQRPRLQLLGTAETRHWKLP
jgi:esterase/lipase superfamily enzyme